MGEFPFKRRLSQYKMADSPSAFRKVLQLQSQLTPRRPERKWLLWQHRWRPIFLFLRFKITASSRFRVGGGGNLTPAQQLHLANLLPDSVARGRWQPMKRPGACVIVLEPGWNNQKREHWTVSMVTSLSNLTGPIYEHWKIPSG